MVEKYYQKARTALAGDDADAAIDALREGIARFSKEAGFYNLMAIAHAQVGSDRKMVESHLVRATELDPNNAVYQENLAKLRDSAGSTESVSL
jgi:Flp pilus assembly protein TadD